MASEDMVGKSRGDTAVATIVNLAEEATLAREGVKGPDRQVLPVCRSLFAEGVAGGLSASRNYLEACIKGLSLAQADRVTGKLPLKGDTLTSRKLGILNVLEAMLLAPEIVYPIYLAGASDSQESVAKRGDELLKRKASTMNLEDAKLIKRLIILFNGVATMSKHGNVLQFIKLQMYSLLLSKESRFLKCSILQSPWSTSSPSSTSSVSMLDDAFSTRRCLQSDPPR